MWHVNEKKASIWTRLDADCDIDEFIYGDECNREVEENGNESDR